MSIQLFVVSLFPLFGLFQLVLWNSERRQTASKGKILKSVCVCLHPEVSQSRWIDRFSDLFPLFDVFPSFLGSTVTCCQKAAETYSSGSCTGFTPVSLTEVAVATPSSKHRGKITQKSRIIHWWKNFIIEMRFIAFKKHKGKFTKNIQRGDVHNFFRIESVYYVKNSKFAQK